MIIIGDTKNNKELYRGKDKSMLSLSAYDIINVDGVEYRILCKGYNFQTKEWFISAKVRGEG